MNIYTPSTPRHLKITQTMIEDFILDPVLGIQVIFNAKLDTFQKCRAKICWWTPFVMDSSGFSSAKTLNLWYISNLRALLFPGHVAGVYYPNFESVKRIYWKYYREIAARAPLFRAQMGMERIEGLEGATAKDAKAMDRGPSCFVFRYKNESQIMCPAANWLQGARTQAGYRFNDLYIDEWTKVEAGGGGTGGEGIDDQLIGRTTKESFNKNHPIWMNHFLFLATAEDTMHPAYERYQNYVKEVKQGNPDYYVFSFNFKDYSDRPFEKGSDATFKDKFRADKVIHQLRIKGKAGYLQEALGFWSKNGRGWYTGEILDRCYDLGRQQKAEIYCSRQEDPEGDKAYYFLGVDPARAEEKKADDGALVVLRAVPLIAGANGSMPQDGRAYKLSFCYAYQVRRADGPQWSAIIHRKHQHFGFTGIAMDSGGGGIWVQPELAKREQTIRGIKQMVRPIATLEDEETMMVAGDFILAMFRPKDSLVQRTWGAYMPTLKWENLIDTAHVEFRDGLSQGIAFPAPLGTREHGSTSTWSEERKAALDLVSSLKRGIGAQLQQIFVVVDETGTPLLSKQSAARKFASKVRKDFAYAAMYAYCRFRMWLATGAEDVTIAEEDAAMCGGEPL